MDDMLLVSKDLGQNLFTLDLQARHLLRRG
ncbi:MAG: hypothetical protein RLZZ82_465 [Actinomycetota bacterium]